MANERGRLLAASLVLLAGCVTAPTGPSVMALPGTGKSFDEFRMADAECRAYAQYQTGGVSANKAAVDSGVATAALGTVVGAAAGAAIGNSGRDAAVGAGAGLLFGAMVGASAAQESSSNTQQAYDASYIQCMYGKGQRVPVQGNISRPDPMPLSAYPPPPPPPRW